MAWLGMWAKRKKITVDNTNIDSDLTHFPVPILLGVSVGKSNQDVSDIFDDLGSNSKKIAITESDGVTQLYAEIELWDNANNKAVIWVSSSNLVLSSSGTTDLYFYFDPQEADNAAYIGDTSSSQAQNVWDSNHKAVYHMEQNPATGGACILDSTANANHATPQGGMGSADLVAGLIGRALDFDSSDYLNLPDNDDFKPDYLTIEAVCKTYSGNPDWARIFDRYRHPYTGYAFAVTNTGKVRFHPRLTGNLYYQADTVAVVEGDGNWHYLAGSYGPNHIKMYDDGGLDEDVTCPDDLVIIHQTSETPRIGDGVYDNQYSGIISELRVSDIARSDAWIKVVNYSLIDDLVTFDSTVLAPIILADMSLDIELSQEQVNSFPIDIHLAEWANENIKSDISAFFQFMGEVPLNVDLICDECIDKKIDIFAALQDFHFLPLNIRAAIEKSKNIFMDIYLSNGFINQDIAMDILLGDGGSITDITMDIMVVSTMPEFKSIYAMHLNSAIREVVS
nr:LamG domain-containing protein [uncultured Desulfobacter sp.]